MPPIQFVVDRREAGKTLAAVLKTRYGLSWSQAKRLVESRHVKVSGQVETDVARRLKLGKRVELAAGTVEVRHSEKADSKREREHGAGGREGVKGRKGKEVKRPKDRSPSAAERRVTPSPFQPFTLFLEQIVYSDDWLVVVNKPAGLTTMRHKEEAAEFGERARKFLPKTLADLLQGLLGTPGRPVISVHRIDRDTSGLVVFARTRSAAESLTRQFRKHTVDRRYLALTRGVPAGRRIESVFVRDRGDGRRGSTSKPDAPDGKKAVTHVKVLEELGKFALVECRLETGRTHQVRIHLGEAGAPLCGERVYDRPVDGKPFEDESVADRPMLHAARLGFMHPESGEVMMWEVSPPEDFDTVLKKLRTK
jgi:23S rRNA pseudouridine1911/1915/1917 synthase